jgi:glycine cleavage system H protein
MAYPANYKYTREHEWIDVTDKVGTVGITDHAQKTLGDIVFVEMPKVGDKVGKNAPFGSVESVKAVSELFAPVSGKVTEINEDLESSPEEINEDAHSTWIIKIELSDTAELSDLLSAADYEKFIAEEGGN